MKKNVIRKSDNVAGVLVDVENGFMVELVDGTQEMFTSYNTLKKKFSIGSKIEETENAKNENEMGNDEMKEQKNAPVANVEETKAAEIVADVETKPEETKAPETNVEEQKAAENVADGETKEPEKSEPVEIPMEYELEAGNEIHVMSFDRIPDRTGQLTKSELDLKLLVNNNVYYFNMVNAKDGSFALMLLCDSTNTTLYKSAKWSIKDTCAWLGEREKLSEAQISEMTKTITALRKAFKRQAKEELAAEIANAIAK